ncbi:MAG TPA: histidine--tRNA ligase [Armatimonadota bacterium]|jgi:histidyl-tRNA synthetase
MRYRRPRGVNDILPAEIGRWQQAESAFRSLCDAYRYQEIRTPLFEQTELFQRAVGAETDIVSKEMYTFEDRGGRSLTLRAEGTAPVVRAFIEDNLQGQDRERLVKLFYFAPIFRYERPQAGRYRQHHQCGIEALGSAGPGVDAEVISLAFTFYRELGITPVTLLLNSVGCPACRPHHLERLRAHVAPHLAELCEDCQRRYAENPLRLLDCKQETCRALTADAPSSVDMLCDECGDHFTQVQATLQALEIPYTLQPRLVRGLDYYTKTAFEFTAPGLGAQDSIGGGGRYDGLVQQCGGPATPAVGIGMGLERILIAQEAAQAASQASGGTGVSPVQRTGLFVVALGDAAWLPAQRLCAELRAAGHPAEVDYRRRSMRAQLSFADKESFRWAAILGEDEIAAGTVTVRDLVTGEQQTLPASELLAFAAAEGDQ